MPKSPQDMTLQECLEAIKASPDAREHDLDCEEGIGSDRCIPCLIEAALEKPFEEL